MFVNEFHKHFYKRTIAFLPETVKSLKMFLYKVNKVKKNDCIKRIFAHLINL
jgi:hypothetical protein